MTKDEMMSQVESEEVEETNIEDSGKVEIPEYVGNKPISKCYPDEVPINPIPKVEELKDEESENDKIIDEILDQLRGIVIQKAAGLVIDVKMLAEQYVKNNPTLSKMINAYNYIIDNVDGEFTEEDIEIAKHNAKVLLSNLIKQYTAKFQPSVDIIMSSYVELKEGAKGLLECITVMAPSIMLPETIVTGSAVGAPNVVKIIAMGKQLVASMTLQLNQMTSAAIRLLNEAKKIGFPIPEAVLNVIKDLSTLSAKIFEFSKILVG